MSSDNYYNPIEEKMVSAINRLKKRSKHYKWLKYFYIFFALYDLYFAITHFAGGSFLWSGVFLLLAALLSYYAYDSERKRKANLLAVEFIEKNKLEVEKFIQDNIIPGIN